MGFWKNVGVRVQEYVYDFSVDAGATGAVSLSSKSGYAALPSGAVVKGVMAKVLTTLTSGGVATVKWGNTGDTLIYSRKAHHYGNFAANFVMDHMVDASVSGRVVLDQSTDLGLPYAITATATTQDFVFTIGTAALTAGKIVFLVEYYHPSL